MNIWDAEDIYLSARAKSRAIEQAFEAQWFMPLVRAQVGMMAASLGDGGWNLLDEGTREILAGIAPGGGGNAKEIEGTTRGA